MDLVIGVLGITRYSALPCSPLILVIVIFTMLLPRTWLMIPRSAKLYYFTPFPSFSWFSVDVNFCTKHRVIVKENSRNAVCNVEGCSEQREVAKVATFGDCRWGEIHHRLTSLMKSGTRNLFGIRISCVAVYTNVYMCVSLAGTPFSALRIENITPFYHNY